MQFLVQMLNYIFGTLSNPVTIKKVKLGIP